MKKTINDDPTRSQMRRYLIGIWPNVACEPFNRRNIEHLLDLEMATYHFSSDYHSGQWSNLYSALSVSEYRPGAYSRGFDDANTREENITAFGFYCALIRKYIKGRS